MFDIGWLELFLIAVVGLLVLGPERLPEALRTMGLWLGRLRRSFTTVKAEIEKEIGMDEVRRQLHNESVMEEMKRIEREVQNTVDEARIDPHPAPVADAEQPAGTLDVPLEDVPPEEGAAPDAAGHTAEPPPPLPRSEAEIEAAFARKQKAEQAGTNEQD